jgi:PilZ domain
MRATVTFVPVKRLFRKLSDLRRSEVTRIKSVLLPPRQLPRVYLATDVKVEAHELAFTARSVQLGAQGMSLENTGQLSMAQPVLVTFALPTGYTVSVGAVVRWKSKQLVGLRFDPRDHNRHIREWIQESPAAAQDLTADRAR